MPLNMLLMAFGAGICCGLASVASAQTLVSGNISGTWSPSGNPYIATDNCTNPLGTTLTLQPGVVFWIGSKLTVTVNGTITAVGTPTQRITIQAPGTASYYWNTISIFDSTGTTNRFHYCDFLNAQTAVTVEAYAASMVGAEILNCTFSNCISQAILGISQGDCNLGDATFRPVIKNCIFSGTSNGCVMNIVGSWCSDGVYGHTHYGYAYPIICGNIFQNLTGTAFLMTLGTDYGSGNSTFLNNTIIACRGGVTATDPWDALVQDNIFMQMTNAIKDTGALMRTVSYNAFYQNATNFTDYPGTYGQPILVNRNGTSCDVLYNIFQNPQFIAANDFHLQSSSTCINAGAPGTALLNLCFPPSISTNFPDLGAYGGPDACNWLDTVPILPAQLSMTKSNGAIWLNWEAIPRSTYGIEYNTTNNFNAMAGTNRWLTNSVLTPISAPVSVAVSPNPPTNSKAFYRVKSLGRTPGN